ncbi:bifunctional hydroxymethylpyrimidine kinase/phosphomethylpyrimidine kinase [Hellea sp.]|nr:bifunctional hydroxymethylpyrimidine kinase/phosphomethylpyrimidine kinase [Hellea sp.]MDA8889117.1 bifunctional hydroxymethylpyrimidine kinase/phosphomethylpyrimidine kinase [Hellea sp.]MDB4844951.1 bifunctional hydroxymethylpyrimidine kinase/phosphomethylpyrimidine kinase [Hellea sp.]MDC0422493.1 bifunctional hydroxymethylpyrimidine kinase/phosphomethylpyrimidine kinase [Hellea sp.]MDC0651134.1 bifunctional hydroxymethylpyrimidine kinase/phosphomethylpyrimidine kinase [Hellea sp.]MDC10621
MDKANIPKVLIIAGSDSSGGAGVQADIKTCAAFGVYTSTAITAITAQNTVGVQDIMNVPPKLVREQIKSVLSDVGADVIKIGMLGNSDIIKAVAEEIEDSNAFIILDPVMVASTGSVLLEKGSIDCLKSNLLPLADLITPNVPEAELLTGNIINDVDDLVRSGEFLLSQNSYSALMKGGHLKGKSVFDVLVTNEGANIMSGPRLNSRHTHGTGCTLSSGIASCIALGSSIEEAVISSREFVYEAIKSAPKLGQGNGPLNHGLVNTNSVSSQPTDVNNPFSVLKSL